MHRPKKLDEKPYLTQIRYTSFINHDILSQIKQPDNEHILVFFFLCRKFFSRCFLIVKIHFLYIITFMQKFVSRASFHIVRGRWIKQVIYVFQNELLGKVVLPLLEVVVVVVAVGVVVVVVHFNVLCLQAGFFICYCCCCL